MSVIVRRGESQCPYCQNMATGGEVALGDGRIICRQCRRPYGAYQGIDQSLATETQVNNVTTTGLSIHAGNTAPVPSNRSEEPSPSSPAQTSEDPSESFNRSYASNSFDVSLSSFERVIVEYKSAFTGLRLYIAPGAHDPGAVLNFLRAEIVRADYPVSLLESETGADLYARERDGRVEFVVGNSVSTMIPALKLLSTFHPVAEQIHHTLRAASQFFRHLHHTPAEHQLRDKITVELHELRRNVRELDSLLRSTYQPYGENKLRLDYGHLVTDVEADDKTAYGITIRSQFAKPLHVWAFYFDCSDLSIMEYYQPPAQGPRGEPSLAIRGVLTIGHGVGGGGPFKYSHWPSRCTPPSHCTHLWQLLFEPQTVFLQKNCAEYVILAIS
ncbi:hypothetical protein PENSPDRAFT_230594 [Peniophora sp. CONT]|nr:hypothetical protein PENSPDRAFT_230594 [Peniophora sp. CONT]